MNKSTFALNSDLFFNATRILILIDKIRSKKIQSISFDRIVLYDYYLKFPLTMFEEEKNSYNLENFNEYYSFFHWNPNRYEYISFINLLLAKGLIGRDIIKKEYHFYITEKGISFVSNLTSGYATKINDLVKQLEKKISKLSNNKIENDILEKIKRIQNERSGLDVSKN